MIGLLKTLRHRFSAKRSYGQFGEDATIQALFKNTRKGVYLDIGAYNPVLYSNTYALYRCGWSGVVVDPNRSMETLYHWIRPRDRFENAGVGEPGEHTYFLFSDGAYNTFDHATAKRLETRSYPKLIGTRSVRTLPLGEIVQKHKLSHIDYLNIDVEGMDLEVLKTHNWNVPPTVISVENSNTGLCPFLQGHGYEMVASVGQTLVFKKSEKISHPLPENHHHMGQECTVMDAHRG